ncbi:MAG TPA: winged helix-turn-helix transcriptional regulator [Kofleriaceae bacterium]|nr:winged helix-turn-helix transcriptional regulator [Kofleriaceae bacterium]
MRLCATADFLEEKKREIDKRLKELRPLVDEYERLQAASAALDGVAGNAGRSGAAQAPARRTRRARTGGSTGTGRRGRPRGTGTRSKQALELVQARPGISIPEIAEAMGIQQNYLYRVLPALQKDGLVRKEGRGWHPREAA